MSQQEMVKISTWVLCLCDENTDMPTFYYNHEEDVFQRGFTNKCAFLDEKTCLEKQSVMNLEGVQVVKGTTDYPKEQLKKIIGDFFAEEGLL